MHRQVLDTTSSPKEEAQALPQIETENEFLPQKIFTLSAKESSLINLWKVHCDSFSSTKDFQTTRTS
jgi:hypothetical protein